MAISNEAVLSSEKNFTVFRFDGHVIRFRAPYSLERYTKVKEWDQGYLVVMAKYRHNDKITVAIKIILTNDCSLITFLSTAEAAIG